MQSPENGLSPPALDIILVNWNAGDQLRRCLESITVPPDTFHLEQVVVVDNASSDGSSAGLKLERLPLIVLTNAENRGFGAACNQGAAGSKADYLLFLNPDTILEKDSLAAPLQFMERPENAKIGVCGIKLVGENGLPGRTCTRIPTPAHFASKMLGLDRLFPRRFPSHFMEEWDHATSREVDHVIGAFYLIRRSVFQQAGGFDERFFVYLEDLDLSLRVHQAGYGIHYLADASAYHKGGGTSEQVKATRLYYALRSRILYGFKHFQPGVAFSLAAGTLLLEPWARLVRAILQRSPAAIKETVGGYRALWSVWPPWKALPR